jgi:hypothetical protein
VIIMVTISNARWTTRLAGALLALAASSIASLISADSARADSAPTMEFSADGTHWTAVYSTQLFAGVVVVPGGSATRTFWVRNDAPEQGVLRVTLANVTTDDTRLADALSLRSSTPDRPGSAVAVSAAQPCYTLSQGQLVDARDAVRIDTEMALADLDGSAGQTGWVSFVLRITFSSTDQAAPAPDTCPADAATVGGVPVPPTAAADSGDAAAPVASTVFHRGASGWVPGLAGTGSASAVAPTQPVAPVRPSEPFVRDLAANTYRFYQEYDVALWLAMLALGAILLVVVRRRRHRAEDRELTELHPHLAHLLHHPTDPHHPNPQNGTPR